MFMPHGWCMTWNPTLIGLHVVTDALVALSYYSIPAALFVLALKKRVTIPVQPLLILFGLFIALCGGGHALDIVSIWKPLYWLKGFWNAATALTSVVTAIVLIPRVHGFLKMPEAAARLEQEKQQAQEQHGLLRAVIDSISEGILLKGEDGHVLTSNAAAAAILGGNLELNWASHRTVDRDEVRLDDGRVIERFTTAVPNYGQLYVLSDVTERIRNETARRRLELIVNTMRQGFCIIALDQKCIATANASLEELHGFAPGELVAKPVTVLFAGTQKEQQNTFEAIAEVATRDGFWEGEIRCGRRDGSAFFGYSRFNLHVENGQRFLSMIESDITEQKRLEDDANRFQAKLLQTAKLESLGVLAGGVAHDFNNLLTGILGNASLSLEILPEDTPVRKPLSDVVSASERAAELTRQLLAYSGRGRFVVEPISLPEKIQEIRNLLDLSIPGNVDVRLHHSGALPVIEADAGQIQQLVMNLLINAAEAIGEKRGQVDVTTRLEHVSTQRLQEDFAAFELSEGEFVVLEVADNGCGMDEVTRSQIFDPFFTTKFTGRGLGLAATIGIVRGHHGGISVQSKPGEGAVFTVLLPAQRVPAAPAASATIKVDLAGQGLVLVVDDEDVARRAAQTTLEHFGYQVITAANGLEALEIYTQHSAQVVAVLLDMTMPMMGGEEVLARMQKIRADVCVLLTSGYNESEAVRRFEGRGIAGFLQKPYTSRALAERIKLVVARGCSLKPSVKQ